MKYFIILFVFNFSLAQSTLMINAEKSNINYSAKHVLHAWEGKNNNIKGVIIFDGSISTIAIAAKVVDFDSGNSGRDSHSLEVLEALKFPNIKFYSDRVNSKGNAIIFEGEIEFHGEKKPIKVLASIEESDENIKINGKFQIIPTEFSLTLPSFMLIEMEDYLNISFSLQFDK
tara:strand:- start:1171 stop:1689 length:519 start_codon:yes stop_codon:yes gene_type:complete